MYPEKEAKKLPQKNGQKVICSKKGQLQKQKWR